VFKLRTPLLSLLLLRLLLPLLFPVVLLLLLLKLLAHAPLCRRRCIMAHRDMLVLQPLKATGTGRPTCENNPSSWPEGRCLYRYPRMVMEPIWEACSCSIGWWCCVHNGSKAKDL
jgi:hypothetical protein